MTQVVDRPESSRFELTDGASVAAFADYLVTDDVITIPHVETDAAHRGQGMAAQLMDGVVAEARRRNMRILPLCSYASAYLGQRPDTHDLIAR